MEKPVPNFEYREIQSIRKKLPRSLTESVEKRNLSHRSPRIQQMGRRGDIKRGEARMERQMLARGIRGAVGKDFRDFF